MIGLSVLSFVVFFVGWRGWNVLFEVVNSDCGFQDRGVMKTYAIAF